MQTRVQALARGVHSRASSWSATAAAFAATSGCPSPPTCATTRRGICATSARPTSPCTAWQTCRRRTAAGARGRGRASCLRRTARSPRVRCLLMVCGMLGRAVAAGGRRVPVAQRSPLVCLIVYYFESRLFCPMNSARCNPSITLSCACVACELSAQPMHCRSMLTLWA